MVALDQYVYAVGGYDSTYQLPTVERYDVEADVWEFISPMNHPRSALACAVVGGKLYALGMCLTVLDIVQKDVYLNSQLAHVAFHSGTMANMVGTSRARPCNLRIQRTI